MDSIKGDPSLSVGGACKAFIAADCGDASPKMREVGREEGRRGGMSLLRSRNVGVSALVGLVSGVLCSKADFFSRCGEKLGVGRMFSE